MSRPFPYTYISCPCADTPVPDPARKRRSRESSQKSPQKPPPERANIDEKDSTKEEYQGEDEDEEQTFDPRSPRSNFSLYPPEQLLYCEECHQIKCPRCITEEIVSWYCPSCLFETPSSMVRSDGNRCGRNCFNCPICTAPLSVSSVDTTGNAKGPWVLSCGYCLWTSLDIGIKFDKYTNVRSQLQKMTDSTPPPAFDRSRQASRTFGDLKHPLSSFASVDEQSNAREREEASAPQEDPAAPPMGADARFAALKNFYRTQISETSNSPSDHLSSEFGFSSPGALNRLMSLYTSSARLSGLYGGSKKPKSKPPVMREALTASEGLQLAQETSEAETISRLHSPECGWDGVASIEQRATQSPDARFTSDLLPLPVLLRTKRAKRCKSCKHILVKPESKPQSTRFRIRLIALSYIPLPTLRPLALSSSSALPAASPTPDLNALPPLRPIHVLLTLKNHMFDPVRITLATPPVTPGDVATKFEIGANSDVWDEALQGTSTPLSSESRSAALRGVPEAGKVWDKGRNWTTVVLEVVPSTLPGSSAEGGKGDSSGTGTEAAAEAAEAADEHVVAVAKSRQDLDVLEIPVFVHMDWDAEAQLDQNVGKGSKAEEKVTRELAYWMVLGVGRIQPSL
ncbi:uncharacterized protein N7515_006542 [Penicillium bovifimosum]|uniref:Dynactin subunit 4 n=1 Tax=Penicillium bovifimosum TaxID=126998 RepID=A0A9W9KZU9_9EURO|nr:uncharacterized protein N7515_006542 [Penicillium bovifimosum]KAJ5130503.1 hypothetical protein N7515_006542 [Penicillium bovifimosum]